MIDFEVAVRAHGIHPKRQVVADGRWWRCGTEDHPKSDNGAYKLSVGGRVGWYWNLALDDTPIRWWFKNESGVLPPVDDARIRAERAKALERSRKGTLEARSFWGKCRPLRGGHPYLQSHGLGMTGCSELRVDGSGWLVVPAMRGGALISLQRISPTGEKLFWKGASMGAVSFTIERKGACVTVLCEGLATGLAIYAAAHLSRVIVGFGTHNMVKLARWITWSGNVVVAADNDHETASRIGRNPGIDAAQKAAEIIGCGVMVPENIDGSDWCDLRQQRLEDRMGKAVYGTRPPSEWEMQKAVDSEIDRAVMRNCRFIAIDHTQSPSYTEDKQMVRPG